MHNDNMWPASKGEIAMLKRYTDTIAMAVVVGLLTFLVVKSLQQQEVLHSIEDRV